jgi:hypothetical protein
METPKGHSINLQPQAQRDDPQLKGTNCGAQRLSAEGDVNLKRLVHQPNWITENFLRASLLPVVDGCA